ncbi:uncharacterized protein LOC144008133 [Festucalex cinctus]
MKVFPSTRNRFNKISSSENVRHFCSPDDRPAGGASVQQAENFEWWADVTSDCSSLDAGQQAALVCNKRKNLNGGLTSRPTAARVVQRTCGALGPLPNCLAAVRPPDDESAALPPPSVPTFVPV